MTRDEAVAFAVAELRSNKGAWWTAKPKPRANDQTIYTWMAQGLAAWSGYKPTEGESPYTMERFDQLLELSKKNSVAFDALEIIAADYSQRGQSLPEPLSEWSTAVHEEQVCRPKKKRGRISERMFFRDVAIHQLLQELVRLGFKPTRNDETEKKDSACDVVADAMKQIGNSDKEMIGFDSIKDIWERLNKRGRSQPL